MTSNTRTCCGVSASLKVSRERRSPPSIHPSETLAVFGDVLPFRQFVLKIHSRCDLACDHCYVYEHADQSWRGRPSVMSPETVRQAAERIAEHASGHRLSMVRVILHGGEPLLAGAARIAASPGSCAGRSPGCALDLRIHTNGVLLDTAFCESSSPRELGSASRSTVPRRQRPAAATSTGALATRRCSARSRCCAGPGTGRCTPACSRRSTSRRPGRGLPRARRTRPPVSTSCSRTPPGTPRHRASRDRCPTGGCRPGWAASRVPHRTRTGWHPFSPNGRRTAAGFRCACSSPSSTPRSAGLRHRVAGARAERRRRHRDRRDDRAGGLDQGRLRRRARDRARRLQSLAQRGRRAPGIRARQQGIAGLSTVCRTCPVVDTCGGGLYAHRYLTGSGFANPSVYCADLEKIITHVRARAPPAGGCPVAAQRPSHSMPQAHFDALAAGFGDAESISYLSAAQRSVRRAVLRLLHERASLDGDPAFDGGGTCLPASTTPPLARSTRCSPIRTCGPGPKAACGTPGDRRRHRHPKHRHPGRAPGVRGGRGGHQVRHARRSGGAGQRRVRAPPHARTAPRGRRAAGHDRGDRARAVRGKGDVRQVAGRGGRAGPGSETEPDWQPVRVLRSGEFTVRLEDTDPYRDCHQWPAAPRLTPAAVSRLAGAVRGGMAADRGQLPQVRAGPRGRAEYRDAAGERRARQGDQRRGQAGVRRGRRCAPATGADLALLLIHEFQHVKLGALLDMFDLCDRTDQRVFYAPWRDDPGRSARCSRAPTRTSG